MAPKQVLLNAFTMNCVGHINHGLWAHPRDTSSQYNHLEHWTNLAKLLERGLFDGLFLADIMGVYDLYQGNVDLTLRESIQLPVNDPLMLVSAMAAHTQHLGFGVTANVSAEAPYAFARRMSTLDHLSRGRIGWNIVTGYLDSAARAMGNSALAPHDRRYDQAEEYLHVLYKLWEGSWADDAVVTDRAGRVYARPERVRSIQHAGEFYQVDGYHLSEPSPQRTPVLFQAGASARGLQFAGAHAECVFIMGQDQHSVRKQVLAIREAAERAGRSPDALKVFMGISVVVADSDRHAQALHQEYVAYASPEAGLAHYAASTGIDLSRYDLDEPIRPQYSNAIQSAAQALTAKSDWTVRKILQQNALGGRYPALVGGPATVCQGTWKALS